MRMGSATRMVTDITSTDQLNHGTRRMFMPGARVVRMLVATDTVDASRPTSASAAANVNRSTKRALPPLGPPLAPMATTDSTEPMNHAQKPVAARRGKASERAPSCSGTTARAAPIINGSSTM